MIRFQLTCDKNHSFESWFASNTTFEKLQNAGMVSCSTCGSNTINKSLMAPALSPKTTRNPLKEPGSDTEKSLTAMRKEVESKSDYVGLSFATEARAMHDGSKPTRPIYGEAKLIEARELVADGIPVVPLPFMPKKHTH